MAELVAKVFTHVGASRALSCWRSGQQSRWQPGIFSRVAEWPNRSGSILADGQSNVSDLRSFPREQRRESCTFRIRADVERCRGIEVRRYFSAKLAHRIGGAGG